MTTWIIPGAASLSEFVGLPVHQYGDCGPDATLMALHALWPNKYSLSGIGLGELDAREEAAHYAETDGAQTITSIHAYLLSLGVSHAFWGFGTPDVAAVLHNGLHSYITESNPDPYLVEFSEAGLGFHDDEPGVRFHFATFFGGTDDEPADGGEYKGGYFRGDGDSRTDSTSGSTTPLILTPWPDVVKASPIGIIRIYSDHSPARLVEFDTVVHGPTVAK